MLGNTVSVSVSSFTLEVLKCGILLVTLKGKLHVYANAVSLSAEKHFLAFFDSWCISCFFSKFTYKINILKNNVIPFQQALMIGLLSCRCSLLDNVQLLLFVTVGAS